MTRWQLARQEDKGGSSLEQRKLLLVGRGGQRMIPQRIVAISKCHSELDGELATGSQKESAGVEQRPETACKRHLDDNPRCLRDALLMGCVSVSRAVWIRDTDVYFSAACITKPSGRARRERSIQLCGCTQLTTPMGSCQWHCSSRRRIER
jgi:hypothetical protein